MMECIFHFPNCSPLILNSFCHKSSSSSSSSSSSFNPFPFTHSPVVIYRIAKYGSKSRVNLRPLTGLPETRQSESAGNDDGDSDGEEGKEQHAQSEFSNDYEPSPRGEATVIVEGFPQGSFAIVSACLVGLLTGISVVLFNNAVHEIRDYFWDGIQYRGASWLREEPIEVIWKRVILVPACGGLIVSMLNILRSALDDPSEGILKSNVKAALQPFLKAMAACITLGTGNSLGPEGPSVEIGASIAKGYGTLFDRSAQSNLSLVAAGSAAGISSGWLSSSL